jgi:hypothetical protein
VQVLGQYLGPGVPAAHADVVELAGRREV